MDVGCGTGILSLFAAKAGASRVVAVEASEKMAKVATKVTFFSTCYKIFIISFFLIDINYLPGF
jgi:predicted RNA methylase